MAEAQDDSLTPENQPAPEGELVIAGVPDDARAAVGSDMTVAEMRQWLRNWIGNATGQSPDGINDSTPMVELGLSSRDAVAMASDIEDLTGVTLTATVAFRHPTIESLATVIVEGEPEPVLDADEDWTRAPGVDDIARFTQQTFTVQEPHRQFRVVARRAHRHRDRAAGAAVLVGFGQAVAHQSDFEGLLDRDDIAAPRVSRIAQGVDLHVALHRTLHAGDLTPAPD